MFFRVSSPGFVTPSANMAEEERAVCEEEVLRNSVKVMTEIHESTLRKLHLFDSIRGKDVRESKIPFWDIVVITAVDEKQLVAYELQIEAKLSRGELPKGVVYKVVNDPPGPKIGNGGATLHAIVRLEKDFGTEFLSQCKILMLHAGGFSQRLPSASVLGKIFTAVPYGDPLYQMFEIKLALCIDFPQRMSPGIFITCPDIMEPFSLKAGDWTFHKPGITAIAHPSPIEIGTTHGVFILAEKPHVNCSNHSELPSVTQSTCIQFLHKPSMERMHEANAVFLIANEEYVYTDGEFFIDWMTTAKLVNLYQKLSPLACEIDAFGDFLQALGENSNKEYCKNVANVVEVVPKLVEIRERFYDELQGTQFNVLLFNKSKFYHIGTMTEYIEAFCDNKIMRHEMCLTNQAVVRCSSENKTLPVQPQSTCIFNTILSTNVRLGERCVMEYSTIESDVAISDGSIVSNMLVPSGSTVPPTCFFHTVCVTVNETSGLFVTVVFNIKDNVKKVMAVDKMNALKYCGQPMDMALNVLGIKQEDLWPNDCTMTNLWHARLFPVFTSQRDSSLYAIKMACVVMNSEQTDDIDESSQFFTPNRLSMADIVKVKDVKGMLNVREELRKKLYYL